MAFPAHFNFPVSSATEPTPGLVILVIVSEAVFVFTCVASPGEGLPPQAAITKKNIEAKNIFLIDSDFISPYFSIPKARMLPAGLL